MFITNLVSCFGVEFLYLDMYLCLMWTYLFVWVSELVIVWTSNFVFLCFILIRHVMDDERRRKRRKFWIMASSTTIAIATYYYKYIYKEPCMTSLQSGQNWMTEVLNGHPIRCVNAFQMESSLFMRLCEELSLKYGLKESNRMSTIEKVGIFVYIIALGISNKDACERFQRSGETISRAFHDVLEAIYGRKKGFVGLACDLLRPKDPDFRYIPPQIANDERYMPYFKVITTIYIITKFQY